MGRRALRALAAVALLGAGTPGAGAVETGPVWTADGNQASAHLGYAVAPAGDVNGDGYGDFVVGLRSYDAGETNEGRVLVYHGGPDGPATSPAWMADGGQVFAFLGSSATSAGDVNGDGYSDLLVGAPSWDGTFQNEGKVALWLGGPGGLATEPAWEREGGQANATFGTSVAFAGDVDGDGFPDLLVGARGWDGAEPDAGRAFLFAGGAGGPADTALWTFDGDQPDAGLGLSVSTAGDVDGDGYSDVLVGAFRQDGVAPDEGAAFLFRGGPAGPSGVPDWSVLGGQASAELGGAVAPAGDVNGDGYADVLVGVRRWDGVAGLDAGRALLFLGDASGLAALPDWIADGEESNALFGWSVAPAGDVDGDGFADVLVGAYKEDVTWLDDGSARVFLGGAEGLDPDPAWLATSAQAGAAFGWSVAGAGDVDGDGYADVLVGAYLYEDGQAGEGRAYLFRGAAGPPAAEPSWTGLAAAGAVAFGDGVAYAGDVDGDGLGDLLVADPLAGFGSGGEGRVDLFRGAEGGPDVTPDWSTVGPHADAGWGRSVARAHDVNGDGYDDVLVGAPLATDAFAAEGLAAWFPGGPLGLAASPAWEARGGAAGADLGRAVAGLGDADGDGLAEIAIGAPGRDGAVPAAGVVLVHRGSPSGPASSPTVLAGGQTGAAFGESVAGAGDVNGDGLADLLVGEPGWSDGQAEEGRVHLFLGGFDGIATTAVWTFESDEADARLGQRVAPAGDVNGDGFADLLAVAPFAAGGGPDEGRVYLFLGGASGPGPQPAWTWESGQPGAQVSCVAPAGDPNGDGFSDVAIGVPRWTGDALLSGRLLVFAGSDSVPVAVPLLDLEGEAVAGQLGSSVDGRGDADGDGRPDLLVGARGMTGGGAAQLIAANGGPGPFAPARQRRADDGAPVALGGEASGDAFLLRAVARTAAGRVPVALAWQVAVADGPWLPAGGPTAWTDPGPPVAGVGSRVELSAPVTGLVPGAGHRWRVRTLSPVPWHAAGPWRTPAAAGGTAPHLFTPRVSAVRPAPANRGVVPLSIGPAPFRVSTTVRFRLPRAGPARLEVFDVAGRRVARIAEGPLEAGDHAFVWDGRGRGDAPVPAGVYFIRLALPESGGTARAVRLR
jgi:hypothetical protein